MKLFYKLCLLTFALLLWQVACVDTRTGTDPDRIVNKMAVLIADFTLPDQYEPEFGLHALGYTAVAFSYEAHNGHLYLVQSENEADGPELESVLADMVPGYHDAENDLTVMDQQPVTIRGQEVTLVLSEGTDEDNQAMRQATAVFQGKEGPALLVFSESANAWNQAAVDAFLASMQ